MREPGSLWRVLVEVNRRGAAITEQVEETLGLTHQNVSARLSELEDIGVLARSEATVAGSHGKPVASFRLTAAGKQMLARSDALDVLAKAMAVYSAAMHDRAQRLAENKRQERKDIRFASRSALDAALAEPPPW